MQKQEPCYFCITMSMALTIGMLIATFRVGRRAVRLGKESLPRLRPQFS